MGEKILLDKFENNGTLHATDEKMLRYIKAFPWIGSMVNKIQEEFGTSTHYYVARLHMGWHDGIKHEYAHIAQKLEAICGHEVSPGYVGNILLRARKATGLNLKKTVRKGKPKRPDIVTTVTEGYCIICDREFRVTSAHPHPCHCPTCAPNGVGYALSSTRYKTRQGSRHGAAL